MKKFGFTLAEVLITLGIIGIVSAMTMPTLIDKISKNQVEARTKVAYSTITQALKMTENDGAMAVAIRNNNTDSMQEWFDENLASRLQVSNFCVQQAGCWHKQGAVKTLLHQTPSFETKVGIDDSTLGWATITFQTPKGFWVNLDGSTAGTTKNLFGVDGNVNTLQFYFDVNGKNRPNMIGKDIYILIYSDQIGIVPAGYSRTEKEVDKNCLEGNGYWCLSKLMRDSWKIDDKVWKR